MREIKSVKEVKGTTVAEMRKVAPQFGIKNASKHKRVELEQMLVEAVEAKLVEESKATKSTKKARTVSNDQVQSLADALTQTVIKRNVKPEELMEENRKVLIRVMKALHCKRWYRTYDKATMVELILGATA